MIAAFGERARRWATGAKLDEHVIAADETAFLAAIVEAIRRRVRGETFAVALFLDEDPTRFARGWGARVLEEAKSFDERRRMCAAIAVGGIAVDGKRQLELGVLTPDAFALGRAFWNLSESGVVVSEASYARVAMTFGRWHTRRITPEQGDASVPKPRGRRNGAEQLVVWAGSRSADEIAVILCAVEELHLPVYVVCEGGTIPDSVHRCTVAQAEPLLRSAAAILDATEDHPGTALALARFGVPLAVSRTSGASELLDGVCGYDSWNRDSILAAVLEALGRPPPTPCHPEQPVLSEVEGSRDSPLCHPEQPVLSEVEGSRDSPLCHPEQAPKAPLSRDSDNAATVRDRAPLVSVIVPTYNRPKLLARALRSIAAQDYPHVETIVVNDAGRSVRDVAERFGVTLVDRAQNGGHAAALNSGIERARGEYVAFLDDDDLYLPDHLSALVDGLERARGAAAHTNSLMALRGRPEEIVGFSPGSMTGIDIEESLVVCPLLGMLATMIRRDLFDVVGRFDESLAPNDDYEMIVRIALRYDWVHVDRVTCLWSYGGDYPHVSSTTAPRYAELYEAAYRQHPFPDRPLLAAKRRQFVEHLRAAGGPRLYTVGARLPKPLRLRVERSSDKNRLP